MQLETEIKKSGRGIPTKGFRMTIGRKLAIEASQANGVQISMDDFKNTKQDFIKNLMVQKSESIPHQETFSEIKQKVRERFQVLEEITISTCCGINPSLIISGGAGTGKSRIVFDTIESLGLIDYKIIKGKVSPTALFRLLYQFRNEGAVLGFDDCDSIFDDEDSMNLLKAATDTTENRVISWHSNRVMLDEDEEEIPNDFEFNGNIIFISNYDFYREALGNSKQAKHFEAMISRSFVLDVDMKNRDYYLARIEYVMFELMNELEMTLDVKKSIYAFMTKERNTIRELSLRMVKKIHTLMKTYNNEWESKAKILLCKG